MATTPSLIDDPFVDPIRHSEDLGANDGSLAIETTLVVGRNASLTLGTDSLIVLDETYEKRDGSNCCGLWLLVRDSEQPGIFVSTNAALSGSANTRAIPFYNILWAQISLETEITIDYALPTSKTVVRPAVLTYTVDDPSRASIWIAKLLDRSYGKSQKQKRAMVLVNPHSGKGSAEKWYNRDVQPIFAAAKCSIEMVKTKYQGEAIEIAEKLNIDAYDMVVSCSGDGLPHEVFNGLGRRADAKRALAKIAVVQMPCGSGNAMSLKGVRTPLDLVSVTQGETRTLSFLSQSLGIVAESDLATENLRWLGSARFTYGFLVRVWGKTVYPCDIAVKCAIEDKPSVREHYRREADDHAPASERRGNGPLYDDDASASSGSEDGLPALRYGTVNDKLPEGWELVPYDTIGNFYCGNMSYMAADTNFFPAALPNDGFMDLICIDGKISRPKAIGLFLDVENGKFFDNPLVSYRKILGYRIIPKNQVDGYISIDGERVPFEPFQAEIHRGLGTVLSKSGHIYEGAGPR